jgi:membrane protein DedA with SNARE-associated domain
MSDVLDSIRAWPWAWAWLTFFVIVLLRAGGTYGIGRAVAAGTLRDREPGARIRAAMDQVERWGPPAVTVSFFTVGAQTAVNLGAGLARMSFQRYLTGLVPGAVIWATVWSTIGMSAFLAVFTGGAERVAWLFVLLVVVVVAVLVTRSIRRSAPAREPRAD